MVGLAPQCGLRGAEGKKRPPVTRGFGGRYWVRTSDLFRVKEARYHCANRPLVKRGGDGIRTRVDGFAGRCLASRPLHQKPRGLSSGRRDSNPRPSPWQGDALPAALRPRLCRRDRTGLDQHNRAAHSLDTRYLNMSSVPLVHNSGAGHLRTPMPGSLTESETEAELHVRVLADMAASAAPERRTVIEGDVVGESTRPECPTTSP